MTVSTRQYNVSIAAGKRMIAKAIIKLPQIEQALSENTIAIIAGTTNSYVAEELLEHIGQKKGFNRKNFYRGITLPANFSQNHMGRIADAEKFSGDVVIIKGQWKKGLTIFDVIDSLKPGDIIVKGANAVNLVDRDAAVLIGHPQAGTIGAAIQAVIGRRIELLLPIGLEKRISGNIHHIAAKINSKQASGPRYFPVNGTIVTELEAISFLSGCEAELIASGGVSGAEGSYRIGVTGTETQLETTDRLIRDIVNEPPFVIS